VSNQQFSSRADELRAARVPFVHARVVLAERPTSAKPGDEAIILGDGTMEGFVGGTCAERTVREEAMALLRTGETLVVRITPVAEAAQPGKRVVHNPCLSGGTLEVFLEPALPAPLIVVVGQAPIANALLSIGAVAGYSLEHYSGAVPDDAVALVIASHGRDEEKALVAGLDAEVPYIGLVASAKRGQAVLDGAGLNAEERARIRTPAGLDLGARTAEEVAISILAEIVSVRPSRPAPVTAFVSGAAPPTLSIDPVCGMTVFPDDAQIRLVHEGRTVWFCGRGCLEAFAADPAAYGA
jgi:xanthine dehydrogenase accessory factor